MAYFLYLQVEIADMMQSENGGTFEINSRDQLEIRDYMGKRYACFKIARIGKDGKTYKTELTLTRKPGVH